ncbi:MAG TPA: YceI family protein [Mariniflexile sp.]|nr:YceI family protein [Mariniflexile sp.]
MIVKKLILFVIVVMALAFASRDSAIKNTSVIITPESSLFVKGTTNVNNFTCIFNVEKLKNPIPVTYHKVNDKLQFNKTALVLDSNCFDCGGKSINNDFKTILKADKYPQIILLLKEISNFENNADMFAAIDIQIAGVTKAYKIPVKIKNGYKLLITGDLAINLSDYSIVPPKKFLGLVTVNDTIEIFFQLAVREN